MLVFLCRSKIQMNVTNIVTAPAEDPWNWSSSDIIQLVNLIVTALVFVINMHQSYSQKHFQSECMGDSCMSVTVDTDKTTSHSTQ